MITKRDTLIVILAVCVFALVALGTPQKSVERPLKINGNVTMIVNTLNGRCVITDWGEATHTGRYDNQGTGVTAGGIIASGTSTAANGDQIFWEMQGDTVTFTGGTGRFANITGGFQYTRSDVESTPSGPTTLTITFTYRGVGTATY